MCNKRSSRRCAIIINVKEPYLPLSMITKRIDGCMCDLIISLNAHGYKTVGCCCGHGRYPMTVICRVRDSDNLFFDLISCKDVKRKKGGGFYKKDKEGYYYLPEISEVAL